VESPVAATDESDFVTSFAAQAIEIMRSLPELQPASDDGAAPFACHPRESGGPEAAAAMLQTEPPDQGARVRGRSAKGPVAAADESDFVTL
jgi:hypothetical protein